MLPSGWEEKTFQEIADVVSGSTPSRANPAYWNGDIPWATPTDMTALRGKKYIEQTKEKITYAGLENSGARLIPANSLLVTTRASIGLRAICREQITTNQGFKSLVFKKDILPDFFYHYMPILQNDLEARSSGTTFLEISSSEFSKTKVPLPKAEEQRAIARVLDTVDEAMEATSAMLAKQEKIKQGLLQDLLNPMGKTLVPLSSALSGIRGGGTPSKAVASYWSGNIPWASVKDFSENSMYIYATEDMISEAGLHDSASSLIPEKTPLICTRMAVGRSSLTTVPTAINQDVKALFLKDKISAEYIVRHLHYLQSKLEAIAVGSTVKGITLKDLSNLQIYLPDYDRQVEIANILEVVDDNCTLYKDELTKLRALKAGLMQDLLTGKKRVTPALMQQIQQKAA